MTLGQFKIDDLREALLLLKVFLSYLTSQMLVYDSVIHQHPVPVAYYSHGQYIFHSCSFLALPESASSDKGTVTCETVYRADLIQ